MWRLPDWLKPTHSGRCPFNALDADRDLFQAQLSLAEIRLSELLNVVQLYKALGRGWSFPWR